MSLPYHGCFFGRTGTGKSWKARVLAAIFMRAGIAVLVLAPPNQLGDWRHCSTFRTSDVGQFVAMARASRRCALFMELSDAGAGKFDLRILKLFTDGRHLAHRCFFIAQRFDQVAPRVREQCGMLWLFKTGPIAARKLAEEFADLGLLAADSLPDRCFIYKEGNAPAYRVDVAA